MNQPAIDCDRVVIYGGGGHGRVVAEAAEAAGLRVLGFVDDALQPGNAVAGRWPVLALDAPALDGADWIVGVGDNAARQRITMHLKERGCTLRRVVHPSAWVSPSALLGAGVFIGPNAVVHTAAELGEGVIVNSAAVVEHDCRIARHSHIAPGAVLAGGVAVGAMTLVGINASLLPGVCVGQRCVIGAGAVVRADVADGCTVAGVPARVM